MTDAATLDRCDVCGARLHRSKRGRVHHYGAFDACHRVRVAQHQRDEERAQRLKAEREVIRLGVLVARARATLGEASAPPVPHPLNTTPEATA